MLEGTRSVLFASNTASTIQVIFIFKAVTRGVRVCTSMLDANVAKTTKILKLFSDIPDSATRYKNAQRYCRVYLLSAGCDPVSM